jgi:hypothetical protein
VSCVPVEYLLAARRRKAAAEKTELQRLRKLVAGNGTAPKSQNKGGRPKGMSEVRKREAQDLQGYIREFTLQHGSKKGATPYAARKVYHSDVDSRTAVLRANKTLRDFRKLRRKPS